MLFGEKVRILASEKGLTQKDISKATGMSMSRINMVFHDKVNDPRLETIILFAVAFDISVSELVADVHVPRPKKKAIRNAAKV